MLAELAVGGVEGAVAALTARYGITDEHARADVGALLADMHGRRLVCGR